MDTYHKQSHLLIDGELTTSESGQWIESLDPSTEQCIGRIPAGTSADVARAVDAADRAQSAWGALDPVSRGKLLRKVADQLRTRAKEVLDVEVRDTGNTITKMKGDVESAAYAIDFFAGLGTEIKGETIPASINNLHFTLREPYGVVGRIVPFNHPIKFAAHALAAPLMAGNTVVIKPPEQSSLSAGILAEICRDNLPPGVVNIVTGTGASAGDPIVRHPAIKRIAFTGSVPTAKRILSAAAETGIKQITLELGGKNPFIVFPDQDPEKIAELAVSAMNFAWQGQSCGSASRLLIHESLHDRVVSRILEIVSQMRLGDPLDPSSQMGPINSAAHYQRVLSMIHAGITGGANLALGGKRPEGARYAKGYWVEPTVFTGVTPGMRIAREEIFGPVMSIFKWKNEAEALSLANDTEFGLTASIWTHDIRTALNAARQVKAGYVWINGASAHYYGTPFGGMKNSGLGREEGLDELLSYTETKSIHVRLT